MDRINDGLFWKLIEQEQAREGEQTPIYKQAHLNKNKNRRRPAFFGAAKFYAAGTPISQNRWLPFIIDDDDGKLFVAVVIDSLTLKLIICVDVMF